VAQHPSEFGEASRRIRKEHQAELANDRIKAGVLERQRLAIGDYRSIGSGKPGTGRSEHCRRDVGANHHARIAQQGNGRDSGFARPGGHVEHLIASAYFGSRQQARYE
jgi:hypothetical protein